MKYFNTVLLTAAIIIQILLAQTVTRLFELQIILTNSVVLLGEVITKQNNVGKSNE